MKIVKQGITEIYDYTCEEIKERTCPICKTVYEYADSECEIVTADNPNYDKEYRQWHNSFQNYSVYAIPYLNSRMPMRSGQAKTLVCPWCNNTELFDFTPIY